MEKNIIGYGKDEKNGSRRGRIKQKKRGRKKSEGVESKVKID